MKTDKRVLKTKHSLTNKIVICNKNFVFGIFKVENFVVICN